MRAKAEEVARDLHELRYPDIGQAQHELDTKATEAWRVAHPRHKKIPDIRKVKAWEGYAPLLEEAHDELNSQIENYKSRKEGLENELQELISKGCKPLAGDHEVLYDRVSSTSYRSQGFGSVKYANVLAELKADRARANGIPVEIESEIPEWAGKYQDVVEFVVKVRLHDPVVDLLLLRHSPGPDLVESVRLCWSRGVNPRVYNPWLPYGFEERNGLDYFGKYTDPKKSPQHP